jgi:hypothetical protein
MKKLFILFAVLFAFSQLTVQAQPDDEDYVVFNAHLLAVLDITVTDGDVQEITFQTAAEYNAGVWEGAGIAQGWSDVTVNSTGNWDMLISAPDFTGGTGNPIPIENLGVWCEATGNNNFTGPCNCSCIDAGTTQGLTDTDAPLITNNGGNAGDDINDNLFTLHWRMGTMDNASMYATSIMYQLVNEGITLGDYTTTATLTVTAVP